MDSPQGFDLSPAIAAFIAALETTALTLSGDFSAKALADVLDALDAGGPLVGLVQTYPGANGVGWDGHARQQSLRDRLFALRYDLCELDMYRLLYGPLPADMRPPLSVTP